MADKKKEFNITEKYPTLKNEDKNNRHNDNAMAAAALEPEYPRINTENL
jgi:hypothetical protein